MVLETIMENHDVVVRDGAADERGHRVVDNAKGVGPRNYSTRLRGLADCSGGNNRKPDQG